MEEEEARKREQANTSSSQNPRKQASIAMTVKSPDAKRVRFSIDDQVHRVEKLSWTQIRGDYRNPEGENGPDYCYMGQNRASRLQAFYRKSMCSHAFRTWREHTKQIRRFRGQRDVSSLNTQDDEKRTGVRIEKKKLTVNTHDSALETPVQHPTWASAPASNNTPNKTQNSTQNTYQFDPKPGTGNRNRNQNQNHSSFNNNRPRRSASSSSCSNYTLSSGQLGMKRDSPLLLASPSKRSCVMLSRLQLGTINIRNINYSLYPEGLVLLSLSLVLLMGVLRGGVWEQIGEAGE